MDRVYCLNHSALAPAGNLYTIEYEYLIEGFDQLKTVIRYDETRFDSDDDYVSMWKKIVTAIQMYGVSEARPYNEVQQIALQAVIWHYSDNKSLDNPNEIGSVEYLKDLFYGFSGNDTATSAEDYKDLLDVARLMVQNIEAEYDKRDYNNVVINYYAPLQSDFQNLLCLHTATTGMMKISKEIATGSNADTTQQFTFTVKLSLDGNPLTRVVFVKNEGDTEFQRVTPNENGEITLTTIGAGEAWIENLPEGVKFVITELSVNGWMIESCEGVEGKIVKNQAVSANFTNAETTSATVKKVWDDEDDLDGIRPAELVVTLSNGMKVTLNAENNWTVTIENLPKYANGKLIEYTWTEGDMPEGYTLKSTSVDGTVTTLTNAHTHAGKKENGNGNGNKERAKTDGNNGEDEIAKESKATTTKAVKAAAKAATTQTGDGMPIALLSALALHSLVALEIAARRKQML